jgi:hypothetical protein
MDLSQVKLNKTEWDSIEIPLRPDELRVIKLIMDGYNDLWIRTNHNTSIASYLRLPSTIDGLDDHLFKEYFEKTVRAIDPSLVPNVRAVKLRKGDLMKINLNKADNLVMFNVYESKLLELVRSICKSHADHRPFHIDYFTLYTLRRNLVSRMNDRVVACIDTVLDRHANAVTVSALVLDAHNVIEKNKMLIHNEDTTLYSHQRDIFQKLQNPDMEERVATYLAAQATLKTVEEGFVAAENGDDDEVFYAAENARDAARAAVTAFQTPSRSNLVLYTAPTGTGKTLTPLALSQGHAVLFVCAARHVGLALAKSAISVGRKVAFAFGCDSADDIRLHYAAASVYSIHPRNGKIWKVDNSAGEKVQIMICDVKSYLCAMYYMRAFNPIDNLLTFWDEPTIGLDVEDHPLHEHIHALWRDNIVPNMVLSSATLPNETEIGETVANFEARFGAASGDETVTCTTTISSHDCKKTIPLIDKGGFSVMPHYIAKDDYDVARASAHHCLANPTLLRYLDLEECVRFIAYAEENSYVGARHMTSRRFAEMSDVTMTNVKLHYINTVINIIPGCWGGICVGLRASRMPKLVPNASLDKTGTRLSKSHSIGPGSTVFSSAQTSAFTATKGGDKLTRTESVSPASSESMAQRTQVVSPTPITVPGSNPGVYITTKDAYTLTDGPTLFLTDDLEKIAKFYLKQSYIPASTLTVILERINFNNGLSERLADVEQRLDTLTEKLDTATSNAEPTGQKGSKARGDKSSKKSAGSGSSSTRDTDDSRTTLGKLNQERNMLYGMIKNIELDEIFVPNKVPHAARWAETPETNSGFTSDIGNDVICQIMAIDGVNDTWKILLLMGIGVFANHNSQSYTEIMKRMADEQRLYLIIASSDYIYGTNYQFCHGYLGKDVALTQQKAIQSIGRVGRNNIQQTYSVRLRDDAQATLLLLPSENNIEVGNMNRLFSS